MSKKYLALVGDDTWNGESLRPTTETLQSPLLIGVLTLTVSGSTADFPSSGRILIDAEFISYTGKTADTLTGLTRAENGSVEVDHGFGATIYLCDSSWEVDGPYGSIAKLTQEAAGNVLLVDDGTFYGSGTASANTRITALGSNAVFDGLIGGSTFAVSASGTLYLQGIKFVRYTEAVNASGSVVNINGCSFEENGTGIALSGSNITGSITKNIFDNNSNGIERTTACSSLYVGNNTFYSNVNAYSFTENFGSHSLIINNIFRSNTRAYNTDDIAHATATFDYNCYYGNTHVATDTSIPTDYNTLLAWQTATSEDANSLNSDPKIFYPSRKMFSLQQASPCWQGGYGGRDIGAFGVANGYCEGIAEFDNGVLASVFQTPTGLIVLDYTTSGTFATDTIDLGHSRSINRIKLSGYEDPDGIIDYDDSDEEQTIEVRSSDSAFGKADGTPAFDEVRRGGLYNQTKRYFQMRTTLRYNG